jgi:molybdate transport system substrate-binding protein
LKYFLSFLISLLISTSAMAQLEVMISGGFNGPYNAMLPEFQKVTGITVNTKSGASQGSGPKTIKAQLANGTTADVVILSREGLTELIAAGKIIPGTDVDLAMAPLGLGVPAGTPKPDLSTTQAFKEALIKAKRIVVPGSTSGIYLTKELFPRLGLTDQITVTVTERGSQATTLLAAKEVNVAIQPSSEIVNVAGVDYVGRIPNELQLIQTFSAAIVAGSTQRESAQKLIQYLSSPKAIDPIKNSGMDLVSK